MASKPASWSTRADVAKSSVMRAMSASVTALVNFIAIGLNMRDGASPVCAGAGGDRSRVAELGRRRRTLGVHRVGERPRPG